MSTTWTLQKFKKLRVLGSETSFEIAFHYPDGDPVAYDSILDSSFTLATGETADGAYKFQSLAVWAGSFPDDYAALLTSPLKRVIIQADPGNSKSFIFRIGANSSGGSPDLDYTLAPGASVDAEVNVTFRSLHSFLAWRLASDAASVNATQQNRISFFLAFDEQ